MNQGVQRATALVQNEIVQTKGTSGNGTESRLLIECSQNLREPGKVARILGLLENAIDWDHFLTLARRNAVSPLVGRNLLENFSHLLPEDVKESLERHVREHLQRNMFLTGKLIEIVRAFDARNIAVLPFKGPLLAAQAYGDLSARHYVDLDILVQPDCLESAVQLLKDEGYDQVTNISWLNKTNWHLGDKKDIYFRSADGLVNVELHWKLSGAHFAVPFEVDGLWARLETVDLAGVKVRTLPFDDLLIYLCLHGSRHGWERFGWICDVNELIRSRGEIVWKQVIGKARDVGCENVLRLGLYLVHEFFGREFNIPGWKKIKNDLMFLTSAKRIREQLFAKQPSVMALGDRYAFHLKFKEDKRDKWKLHFHYIYRYLRIIFRPREIDTTVFKFPRVLEPLYYLMRPLRLFYNYALRSNKPGTRQGASPRAQNRKTMPENSFFAETEKAERPKVLLLTSSLLVDRVLTYTKLIEALDRYCDTVVWAVSRGNDRYSSVWESSPADVEAFPEVKPFKSFPYVYLRRLNEFVWDFRQRIPTRMSVRQHVRDKNDPFSIRALRLFARLLAMFRAEELLEDRLEKILLSYPRSAEAEERLRELQPSVVVVTGAFQFEQPAVFAAAKKLGIPTIAYIPSWDNITTKNRMVFKYDGYLVWSEQTKAELHQYYPASKSAPVYVVGAPQFDIFFQTRFHETREEFCRHQHLDPALPIVLYAIGSPNFLQEHHGAIEMAKRIVAGELGKVQMLVRPHPIHDNAALSKAFEPFAPHVRSQQTHNAGKAVAERTQDERQIREWINTFRHADVLVNLASTVTVDAALFDCPVINLDFDPQPGQADQKLIDDINHKWNHFKPVAESGGVVLVKDYDELSAAILRYLKDPGLDREGRRKVVQYVCEHTDGQCGERMARAVGEFARLGPVAVTDELNAPRLETMIRTA